MSLNLRAIEAARDRAVVAVLNAIPQSIESEAEEIVNSLVDLIFETMKQYLDEEMYDELGQH